MAVSPETSVMAGLKFKTNHVHIHQEKKIKNHSLKTSPNQLMLNQPCYKSGRGGWPVLHDITKKPLKCCFFHSAIFIQISCCDLCDKQS